MKRIAILISGRGSNMEALLKAELPATVCAVLSNVPDAKGLAIAAAHGVPTVVVDHRQFATREDFDHELARRVASYEPDLVILAGFMRILTAAFISRFQGRLINIHPSLLPAFPGTHTHRRALQEGVRMHGCTVHYVTAELDRGPIIAQAALPVLDDDTEQTLAARVLILEHRLLPLVVGWCLQGALAIDGLRVRSTIPTRPEQCLIAPSPV